MVRYFPQYKISITTHFCYFWFCQEEYCDFATDTSYLNLITWFGSTRSNADKLSRNVSNHISWMDSSMSYLIHLLIFNGGVRYAHLFIFSFLNLEQVLCSFESRELKVILSLCSVYWKIWSIVMFYVIFFT